MSILRNTTSALGGEGRRDETVAWNIQTEGEVPAFLKVTRYAFPVLPSG